MSLVFLITPLFLMLSGHSVSVGVAGNEQL